MIERVKDSIIALEVLGIPKRIKELEDRPTGGGTRGGGGGGSSGISQSDADDRFVNTTGDTMTGQLVFPVGGFRMVDTNSVYWDVTIDTSGRLVTSVVAATGDAFLVETGDFLLLETGDNLLIQ